MTLPVVVVRAEPLVPQGYLDQWAVPLFHPQEMGRCKLPFASGPQRRTVTWNWNTPLN